MKIIGVITALEAEREQLEKIFGKPLKTDLYGHFSIKTYIYNNITVCFAKCGVGEIMASSCTQLLISVYKVELIINYGFAGGYQNLTIGDTVVPTGVVHYDFDTSAIDNCQVGHYLGIFDGPIIKANQGFLELSKKLDSKIKFGVLASADKFVADDVVKERLYKEYGATLYDMESAGILITCSNQNIPLIIVKVISDHGESQEFYGFKELLRDTKANFVKFLQSVIDNI